MKALKLLAVASTLGAALFFSGCGKDEPKPAAKEAPKAQTAQKADTAIVPIEKMGFLTLRSCAEAGAFTDCYLENYMCGADGCYHEYEAGVFGKVELVLYSHLEGHIYNVDVSKIDIKFIDKGINRNEVALVGGYDPSTNTILVTEFKAPPPPKKSFFKGCL